MRPFRDRRAVSRLSLVLLLVAVFVLGALFSYMFMMGWYVSLVVRIPEETSVTIVGVDFSPRDAGRFTVTLLNPSYSPSEATVTEVVVTTTEDHAPRAHPAIIQSPRPLKPGESADFTCLWDWGNYTDQWVGVAVFIEEGSGPTLRVKTPLVSLTATEASFNATDPTHFQVAVENSERSETYVNVTKVAVTTEDGTVEIVEGVSPSLPFRLENGTLEAFTCPWDWTDYRSRPLTVTVYTLEGFRASCPPLVTPPPVNLTVTEALFDLADLARFNLTVQNSELSPVNANITGITVTAWGETVEITGVVPGLPCVLGPGLPENFTCPWNWTGHRGESVAILVNYPQGRPARYTTVTPSPVNLTVTEALFDPIDYEHFNVTVRNSELSTLPVNVTRITVAVGGQAQELSDVVALEEPTAYLPYQLNVNSTVTFRCGWNWTGLEDEEVTIIVYTAEGFKALFSETI